jgi:hypothetical protein
VSEYRSVLERAASNFAPLDLPLERVERGRDRRRRNQRIAAGAVGIAVFVASVWIVTSGGVFDRTETPAVPGSETGPAETAPPLAIAPEARDLEKGECSAGARWRLELTDVALEDRIKVRFEVHESPPGHLWHIRMWRDRGGFIAVWREIWRGARVASDSGEFGVVRLTGRYRGLWLKVKAIDSATGQVCVGDAYLGPMIQ